MQPMIQAQSKISNYRYDFELNPNFQNHNEIQNATAIKQYDQKSQQIILQQPYQISQPPYPVQQQMTAYVKRSGFQSKFESPAETTRNMGVDLNQTMFEESKHSKEDGAIKIPHRDIKFSNKLPNAFRVYRGKHSQRQDSS
jgi:hypothetical protein